MPSTYILSPFQCEKLEYYYRFIVGPNDTVLDAHSMARFNERILDYTGWDESSMEAKQCKEIHDTFFEILIDTVREKEGQTTDEISMASWMSLWCSMLEGVKGVYNLPIYARLMPKELFKIIDRRREGSLSANDLAIFYRDMVHMDPKQAVKTSQIAFEQMTDGGRYPLDDESYVQLFANFLIGRTPYGPGRYIFGCFEHEVQPFQLIQPLPEPNSESDDVQPIKRPMNRRPSKQYGMFPVSTPSSTSAS